MSLNELKAKYQELDKETRKARSFLIEYHKRLVLPTGCIILSLLGLPLGLQASPGRRAIGIPLGIVLYILYYIFYTVARNLAYDSLLHIPTVMWFCNLIFCGLAVVLIYRSAHEKELVPHFVIYFFDRIIKICKNIFLLVTNSLFRIKKSKQPESSDTISGFALRQARKKLRGNVKSRVFHFSECDHFNCKNCSIEFKNVEIALQAGFEPCRFCRGLMPVQSIENKSDAQPQDNKS